ncbi:MAG: NlpC/P60 family protein [Gammaproteobacteria bacterium]|nr:MAG: NlpC/P60 family protein [Gammaproteobacteria bacterium]
MTLKRYVALATVLYAGMASFPLFAQSLITMTPRAASENFKPVEFAQTATSAPVALQAAAAPASQLSDQAAPADKTDQAISDLVLFKAPRKRLADLALKLRDIRYVRGGHEPATGFDCSGFVHYVFRQTFGLMLPYDAPGQFHDGKYVARNQMQTGDLVFFHEGKRISHVGIYLDDGHFIHSPRPGKRVRVDSLDSTYWAKRFAGAKRPDVLS